MTLRTATPERASASGPEGLAEVDRCSRASVAEKAFPGASSRWARTARSCTCGASAASATSPAPPAVTPDTIYDLASLTKIVVTTTMAMILVDEGKLDLDKPVSAFLPGSAAGPRTRSPSRSC